MGNKVWLCKYGNILNGREFVEAVCATQEVAMEWIRREREQVLLGEFPEDVSEIEVGEGCASFDKGTFFWWDIHEHDLLDSVDKLAPQ